MRHRGVGRNLVTGDYVNNINIKKLIFSRRRKFFVNRNRRDTRAENRMNHRISKIIENVDFERELIKTKGSRYPSQNSV